VPSVPFADVNCTIFLPQLLFLSHQHTQALAQEQLTARSGEGKDSCKIWAGQKLGHR